MISIKFKAIVFILLTSSVIYFSSCEKQKITYKNAPAPDGVVLPEQCESCHNANFVEHSTNAHSKHTTGLYTFVCSTCHFGHGWETATHMNAEKNITFDPNGLATRKGADSNTPAYDTGTKTCSNIYCHSNGVTADRGHDSTYTWGTNPPFGTIVYTTTPRWDTGKITDCTYCHNGKGNMTDPYKVSRPNTMDTVNYPASGMHQLAFHMNNNQDFGSSPYDINPKWDGVQCFWCHTNQAVDVASINGPILQGTYSTNYHVDGETFFIPSNISEGGTMANGLNYSSNGTASHCGNSKKCW